jgi:hypothetical protein
VGLSAKLQATDPGHTAKQAISAPIHRKWLITAKFAQPKQAIIAESTGYSPYCSLYTRSRRQ